MSLKATEYDAIGKRGGYRDNSEYEVLRCMRCGTFALYDAERLTLYQDPSNLHINAGDLYYSGTAVTCIACGSLNSFQDALASDRDDLLKSKWSFAVRANTE